MTLADTIRAALLRHCEQGNLVMGQNLSATPENVCVPDHTNIIDLPTSDCSNAGVACGFALAGRRPVLVMRYQGFTALQLSFVANYAAKAKALWGQPCPIFVRAIANEGGIGPVAGGCHHSAAMRFPGIRVVAPMTPAEWTECWQEWLIRQDVVWCSEHRASYHLAQDQAEVQLSFPSRENRLVLSAGVTVIAISKARLEAERATWKMKVSTYGLCNLKPLSFPKRCLDSVRADGKAIVVDSDYATCGAAEHVAMELMRLVPGSRVEALGLEDRVAGFSTDTDVLTPSAEQIVQRVKQLEAA